MTAYISFKTDVGSELWHENCKGIISKKKKPKLLAFIQAGPIFSVFWKQGYLRKNVIEFTRPCAQMWRVNSITTFPVYFLFFWDSSSKCAWFHDPEGSLHWNKQQCKYMCTAGRVNWAKLVMSSRRVTYLCPKAGTSDEIPDGDPPFRPMTARFKNQQ